MGSRRKVDLLLWADVERKLRAIVADACAEIGTGAMTPEDADFLDEIIAGSEAHSPGFAAKVDAAVETRRRRARKLGQPVRND